jgi:type VI secretion system protein VasG
MPDAERRSRRHCGSRCSRCFPPALLGRLVTIPYYPLNDEMIGAIARLQLGRIEKRIRENHKCRSRTDDDVREVNRESRCTVRSESGGLLRSTRSSRTRCLPIDQRGIT